jgi:retron-type reverse transcriptase
VNTDAPWPTAEQAGARVLGIQTKLHRWATDEQARRFCDLYNLVCDPAFLLVGWRRVKGNKGARSAGIDGQTAYYITAVRGEEAFLAELRADLKARRFVPLPVRERLIPKPGGQQRRLGIATIRDRVVQAALKLVLEPIFEADFHPCSYGFRPGRRAQDAIAEIHLLATHGYEWVLEGDITACFDEIDHSALMVRLRRRIGDRRVLALVKAFCKAGILSEDGIERDTSTGTPKAGSCRRCWPTSHCRCWTSTPPRPGRQAAPPCSAIGGASGARRPGGWSATRTTLWSWWPAPKPTPRRCKGRWPRCWPRWGCIWPPPRPGPATSTRASTSSGSASSGTGSEARPALPLHLPLQEGLVAVKAKVRALTEGPRTKHLRPCVLSSTWC